MTRSIPALAAALGWTTLRPGQAECVEALLAGRDVLAVMPTGYGKSAVYQLAGTLLGGVTVVVSPLIALQADQVLSIEGMRDEHPDAGLRRAVAVNSGLVDSDVDEAWDALTDGSAGFVFLSPEQLAKDDVVDRLRALDVRLAVVDEAHVVSSWGHDFRPDYLGLGNAIGRFAADGSVTLALTATGARPVREEIVERLALRDALVLAQGFDRPGIRLEVVRHEDADEKQRAVVDQLVEVHGAHGGPGLLYVATRRAAEEYARALGERGLRAAAYHAGLPASTRSRVHEQFLADRFDVVVATSAFGMGIDKPDVRFVVHSDITDSIDSYYQEVGRAGRDGGSALARLHYRAEDLGLRTFFESGLPGEQQLALVYAALRDAGPMSRSALASGLSLAPRTARSLVNLLEEAGAVEVRSRSLLAVDGFRPVDAARAAIAEAESRSRIELSRIAMMRGYAETDDCRRVFLLGYFGEELPQPCGNCDTCTSGSAYDDTIARGAAGDTIRDAAADPFAVDTRVSHPAWGPGTVMRVEDDRITVFFEEEGYKVLSREDVEERGLLERLELHGAA